MADGVPMAPGERAANLVVAENKPELALVPAPLHPTEDHSVLGPTEKHRRATLRAVQVGSL